MKLDEDVAAAIDQLRSGEPLGFSEALNRLARAGAAAIGASRDRKPFKQMTADLGLMVDVSNIAEVLEILELEGDR